MKTKYVFAAIGISYLLMGCTLNTDKTVFYENQIDHLTKSVSEMKTTITEQEETIEILENFSYLNDFSENEMQAYNQFQTDHDVTHLKHYAPEKIVLLYLHSLATGDVETVHAIAYDDGDLPDLEDFSEQFHDTDSTIHIHESVLTYRYYDSIGIQEEDQTDDEVNVVVTVSSEIHTATILYNVKKSADQWLIDIQHLFE